jgi:hypothetical protein
VSIEKYIKYDHISTGISAKSRQRIRKWGFGLEMQSSCKGSVPKIKKATFHLRISVCFPAAFDTRFLAFFLSNDSCCSYRSKPNRIQIITISSTDTTSMLVFSDFASSAASGLGKGCVPFARVAERLWDPPLEAPMAEVRLGLPEKDPKLVFIGTAVVETDERLAGKEAVDGAGITDWRLTVLKGV